MLRSALVLPGIVGRVAGMSDIRFRVIGRRILTERGPRPPLYEEKRLLKNIGPVSVLWRTTSYP